MRCSRCLCADMTTQSHASHMPQAQHDESFLARHRPLIVRLVTTASIAGAVLLATAMFAPGLVTLVALIGGCALMHLFGHGSHGHGGGGTPSER